MKLKSDLRDKINRMGGVSERTDAGGLREKGYIYTDGSICQTFQAMYVAGEIDYLRASCPLDLEIYCDLLMLLMLTPVFGVQQGMLELNKEREATRVPFIN